MRPSRRATRVVAALVIAAGLAASGLAILSEELGLGAEAARGVFGWKRTTLLVAGLVGAAAGALLLARPQLVSRLVRWEQMRPLDRRVRVVAALVIAAGLAASGLAILAEELGLGAEAARGMFGWKRTTLLVAGLVGAAAGALLFARPRLLSDQIEPKRIGDLIDHLSNRFAGYLAVSLLGLLGVVLVWTRLMHIDASLWNDEAASALTFSEIGSVIENPAGHVLYDILAGRTTALLGESEALRRFWSVVPAIAAVGFATWFAWRRLGPVAAIAFAALAVAAPLHLDVAPQARGYGLALLAATLMLIAADRLARSYSRWMLLGFLGAGVMGIWTLIFFAFAFVGQALSLLGRPKLRLPVAGTVTVAALLSVALYAPVLTPFLQPETDSPAGAWNEVIIGDTYISLGAALLLEHSRDWLVVPITTLLTVGDRTKLVDDPLAPDWAGIAALALIVIAIMALVARKEAGLALILVLPPLLFNLGFSVGDFSTVARHQLVLLPHVLLLVAIGIAELGTVIARSSALKPLAIGAGVVLVLALSKETVEEEQARALPRENFKEAANVVRRAGVRPIVSDSVRPAGFEYYLGDDFAVLPTRRIERLLCERRPELVYIHHPYFQPGASLRCLIGENAVRVRIPQRERGAFIDVWIVDARAGRPIPEGTAN